MTITKNMHRIIVILFFITCACHAASDESDRISKLNDRIELLEQKQRDLEHLESRNEMRTESRMDRLEDDIEQGAFILFVCATLSSLWAMYTRRSSVLWFFLGLVFAPFALIVILWKSSNDLNSGRMRCWD